MSTEPKQDVVERLVDVWNEGSLDVDALINRAYEAGFTAGAEKQASEVKRLARKLSILANKTGRR